MRIVRCLWRLVLVGLLLEPAVSVERMLLALELLLVGELLALRQHAILRLERDCVRAGRLCGRFRRRRTAGCCAT